MTQLPIEERQNDGRCIVAVPTATEPIHHVGDVSEPKHMTVLWLGSPEENPGLDMDAVHEAVRSHAENSGPVTGTVDSQGPLGSDGAQVAFLTGDEIDQLRTDLLAAPELREGTGAVQQFPKWQPHVTLGYHMDQPVADENLPGQVIFDQVGVWDGDEHTEYPLGPSASTEENTEPLNRPSEAEVELMAGFPAMPVLKDAATLAIACERTDAIPDTAIRMATRRVLTRRARALGCQHVIPRDWAREVPAAPLPPAAVAGADAHDATEVSARNGSDVADLFQLKTQLSTVSDTALRAAYMRGVRDYTMTAPNSRPPLPRDVIAQARVNSLIRLAQGDLSARTDDRDLLR